eukprot:COSAG01_NODE_978_length_12357_cov_10.838554_8_plen_82_part_00
MALLPPSALPSAGVNRSRGSRHRCRHHRQQHWPDSRAVDGGGTHFVSNSEYRSIINRILVTGKNAYSLYLLVSIYHQSLTF